MTAQDALTSLTVRSRAHAQAAPAGRQPNPSHDTASAQHHERKTGLAKTSERRKHPCPRSQPPANAGQVRERSGRTQHSSKERSDEEEPGPPRNRHPEGHQPNLRIQPKF